MILNCPENYPATIVSLLGNPLENVESYSYLGSVVKYNEASTGDTELNLRIDAAQNKFYSLGNNFLNMTIQLKTRVKIFNSLVRNRLIYSCPTWTTSTVQQRKINSSYMSMLRNMIKGGYKRKENEWGFVYTNDDIKRICDTVDVTEFVKKQQRKFAAHIIRKDNKSIVKKLFFNNNEARIPGPQMTLRSIILKNECCAESKFCRIAMEGIFQVNSLSVAETRWRRYPVSKHAETHESDGRSQLHKFTNYDRWRRRKTRKTD